MIIFLRNNNGFNNFNDYNWPEIIVTTCLISYRAGYLSLDMLLFRLFCRIGILCFELLDGKKGKSKRQTRRIKNQNKPIEQKWSCQYEFPRKAIISEPLWPIMDKVFNETLGRNRPFYANKRHFDQIILP